MGTIYRPHRQVSFTETITEHFSKINTNDREIYVLGDFNINLFSKQKYIFHQTNTQSMSPEVKNYFQFCSLYGLKQPIKSPTRVTCSTSSLIDHILTTFPERISQQGIIDVGLSDHQLIYCTRKLSCTKLGTHKVITFRSLKNYTAEAYKEALGKVCFPDYEKFSDVNKAYENFIQKLMSAIDKLTSFKTKRVKRNSQEQFDGEVLESIALRDKLFKKFKRSKLNVDKEIYNNARNKSHRFISLKKREYFENRLKENIAKLKDLWKTLKSVGLSKTFSVVQANATEDNRHLKYELKSVAQTFAKFYSNLVESLLKNLPIYPEKIDVNCVHNYYKNIELKDNFNLNLTTEKNVFKVLQFIHISKAAGIDKISGRFLKDGANILERPMAKIGNISIYSGIFPSNCKIAKLKPLYKKGSKTNPENFRPISLLPLISKVIERIVYDQVDNFLLQNNILHNCQSGFWKNHSTDFCLSFLNDKILKCFVNDFSRECY